jgi:CRISPR-associated protein Csx17
MPELLLEGCAPEPLMSYLKALGVFRLVAEQLDPHARLSWRGGSASIHTDLARDGIADFLVTQYRPTPITAPWNGGSGFYGGSSAPLDAIVASDVPRLDLYRHTIEVIRTFVPTSKPKDDEKEALLLRCRSELADEVIPWLDVCYVLGEKGTTFFPLLGTGGNDGRLEFTNNFMQRLADVIPFSTAASPTETSVSFLSASLFADTVVSLAKAAVGQFNPGCIGGANGTQGRFEADSRVNPWDFVLAIEGALLLAGSVARRLQGVSGSRSVFPFSVDSVAVGYGSATAGEETTDGSRAELWLPLWDKPTTLQEVRHLFAEGRAQLGRRQAKNAVEFALAINMLGVSRGVKSFVRMAFLKRNGLAFLATPLGRIEVQLRPEARLLDDPALADWIEQLRRACRDKDKTPSRYQTALRQVDRAIFAFANRSNTGNDGKYLLDVLAAVGRAERTLATGLAFCDANPLLPLQRLCSHWLEQDELTASAEFRLAASLAGIHATQDRKLGSLRDFVEAVEGARFVKWSPGSTSAVWSRRPLTANLAAVFRRRQLEAYRAGMTGVPLDSARHASLADVVCFLNSDTDDEILQDLLWALIGVETEGHSVRPRGESAVVPIEFGLPRLLVERRYFRPDFTKREARWSLDASDIPNPKPDPAVFDLLATGQSNAVQACVDRAAQRLNAFGLTPIGLRNARQSHNPIRVFTKVQPDRLLAAMLFPLASHDLNRIANSVLYPPETQE